MSSLDIILRQALIVVAVICFPVLGVTTMCGVFVAVLQAATQVQEQTLTVLPKMLAVAAMLALFGSFALRLCCALLAQAVQAIPAIVLSS